MMASHNVNTHFDIHNMEIYNDCMGLIYCGAPLAMTFYECMSS